MGDSDQREGELRLPFDPSESAGDAAIVFIGRVRSPWHTRAECPKNLAQARERAHSASLELDAVWRQGLRGLRDCEHLIVLYWMNQARRDLIIQRPRHRPEPVGVFRLRSPARPNPIAIAIVRLLDINESDGTIAIDAIDCLDGTPLVDIKPWMPSIDTLPHD